MEPSLKKPAATPFFLLLPNLVTILGLCVGMTAIRFALAGRFEIAVALIVFAALIDGLDGLLARRLNAASEIGAQLDSLSDFLNFGVVPGIVVYQYALGGMQGEGWIFVLGYVSCCCLRLARFNVGKKEEQESGVRQKAHFVGVPAPAGALLALFPVFLSFEGLASPTAVPWLFALMLGVTGALMVSRIPTISPKAILVPREKIIWILISAALLVGIMLTRMWLLMILVDIAYMVTLLRSIRQARRTHRIDSRN